MTSSITKQGTVHDVFECRGCGQYFCVLDVAVSECAKGIFDHHCDSCAGDCQECISESVREMHDEWKHDRP